MEVNLSLSSASVTLNPFGITSVTINVYATATEGGTIIWGDQSSSNHRAGFSFQTYGGIVSYVNTGRTFGSNSLTLTFTYPLNKAENFTQAYNGNQETWNKGFSVTYYDGEGHSMGPQSYKNISFILNPITPTALTLNNFNITINEITKNSLNLRWGGSTNYVNYQESGSTKYADTQLIIYEKKEGNPQSIVSRLTFYNNSANTNYLISGLEADKEYEFGFRLVGDGMYFTDAPQIRCFRAITPAVYQVEVTKISNTPGVETIYGQNVFTSGWTFNNTGFTKSCYDCNLLENKTYTYKISVNGDGYYYPWNVVEKTGSFLTEVYRGTLFEDGTTSTTITFGFNELNVNKTVVVNSWGSDDIDYEGDSSWQNISIVSRTPPSYNVNVSATTRNVSSTPRSNNVSIGYTYSGNNYKVMLVIKQNPPVVSAATYTPSSIQFAATDSNSNTSAITITNSGIVEIFYSPISYFSVVTGTSNSNKVITVSPSSQNTSTTQRTATLMFSAYTTTHIYTGTTSLVQEGLSSESFQPLWWNMPTIFEEAVPSTGVSRTITVSGTPTYNYSIEEDGEDYIDGAAFGNDGLDTRQINVSSNNGFRNIVYTFHYVDDRTNTLSYTVKQIPFRLYNLSWDFWQDYGGVYRNIEFNLSNRRISLYAFMNSDEEVEFYLPEVIIETNGTYQGLRLKYVIEYTPYEETEAEVTTEIVDMYKSTNYYKTQTEDEGGIVVEEPGGIVNLGTYDDSGTSKMKLYLLYQGQEYCLAVFDLIYRDSI